LTHEQLCFDLLQRIENYSHHNEQGSTSKERRELLRYAQTLGNTGQNTHQRQQDRTGKSDPVHDSTNVVSSGLAGLYTRHESIVLLQVIGNLLGTIIVLYIIRAGLFFAGNRWKRSKKQVNAE
jgi:hypothetical protein